MHINYIILAHKAPEQLVRLITKLDGETVRFYIHIDLPVDITSFLACLQDNPNCIFLTGDQRLNTMWGHVNAVKAALNGMNQIIADGRLGYTVLLSGQDYPIKSNEYILEFFKTNYGSNFIECFPLPVTIENAKNIHGGLNKESWINPEYGSNGGMDRLTDYTFFLSKEREDKITIPSVFSKKFLNRKNIRYAIGLLRRQPDKLSVLFKRRTLPVGLLPYAGSQWWALPAETVVFLCDYVKKDPEFLNFNEYTLLSDEIFFQTVVANNFKNIAYPVTYVNFVRPIGPWPATFAAADISELTESRCLFARKFDKSVDNEIFDLIDDKLL